MKCFMVFLINKKFVAYISCSFFFTLSSFAQLYYMPRVGLDAINMGDFSQIFGVGTINQAEVLLPNSSGTQGALGFDFFVPVNPGSKVLYDAGFGFEGLLKKDFEVNNQDDVRNTRPNVFDFHFGIGYNILNNQYVPNDYIIFSLTTQVGAGKNPSHENVYNAFVVNPANPRVSNPDALFLSVLVNFNWGLRLPLDPDKTGKNYRLRLSVGHRWVGKGSNGMYAGFSLARSLPMNVR
ncbi:MAG: hypothetical protein R3C61_18800 [Bacteroidia bacterium]